uniref:Sec-independent protein translocase component TatC n=1 Tax=Polysiphonia scopulorum TaxID=257860 RepID=A0A1Z1MIC5_9FLOR|nr:Sec-independent protein translocase component TatC [Polysiphonia scopulorum]ARW65602.1 Sec-independent protein translocase component TatC [Polysiphonia scopulorum]
MKEIQKNNEERYMPIVDHLTELKTRFILSLIVFLVTCIVCLFYVNEIALILQKPATGIKFLQLAPGEYLFVSIKVSIYLGIVLSSPFSIYQITKFVLPGLTKNESKYLIPILTGSISLFFLGIIFSYNLLIPTTLNFLIYYGSDIVEPIWSFDEYFNFVILVIVSTGICFQIPIIQILLGLTNIVRWQYMLYSWKYVIFLSTIIGAVITPSTDPVTQVFMTITILMLYFIGIIILKIIKTE